MDFAEILDKWEKQTPQNKVYNKDKSRDAEFPDDPSSEAAVFPEKQRGPAHRSKLLRKKPEASIDLHGLSTEEAWTALQSFFQDSRRKGLEKIRIVHGKGNHSSPDSSHIGTSRRDAPMSKCPSGVLRDLSRRFIETCPFAGESGHGSAKEGGSGATWVILK